MLLMKFDRRNKAKYNFNFDILNTKCLWKFKLFC
jgi:hypothetical protein